MKQTIEEYMLWWIDNDLKNLASSYRERRAESAFHYEIKISDRLSILEAIYASNGQCHGYDDGQEDRSLRGRYEWIRRKYAQSQTYLTSI